MCRWPPLWCSSHSSWLQIQKSEIDSRRYQISWEVVALERGTLSLVSIIKELLGRKSRGSGLESREYSRMDLSRWPRDTLCPQKLTVTSPTSCGRSVAIVRLRTKTMEFRLICVDPWRLLSDQLAVCFYLVALNLTWRWKQLFASNHMWILLEYIMSHPRKYCYS
jgi:hypothetical protein